MQRIRHNLIRIGVICFSSVATLTGLIVLDIFISRSLYHPLTYLYRLLSFSQCQFKQLPCPPSQPDPLVESNQGMVVTAQHHATQVGVEILQQGGNAIDAAVAIGYALAVVHPCCGNLGGGGFMTLRLASGETAVIDFREQAPSAATAQMYLNEAGEVVAQRSRQGYLAVGIPGTVAGFDLASEKFGTMSLAEVIAPAQTLAEDGFTLRPGDVRILQSQTQKFQQSPELARVFLKPEGKPYQAGERLVQPDLANTLATLANEGTEAFYTGEIARKIVTASQASGGILTLKDFTNYRPQLRDPLRCSYRGYMVFTVPPPGGGLTLCQMLLILEGYPLAQFSSTDPQRLHWLFSAMLFAYQDRNTYLADPAFVEIPQTQLLAPEYIQQRRNLIPDQQALSPDSAQIDIQEGTNTTHYSVVDRFGNAVAVTYTLNSLFGAGVMPPDTGIVLNNEMDDFTAKPGTPNQFGLVQGKVNQIEPGKRPLSSMSPTIILNLDEELFLVTGSPGGPTIPTTILQVMSGVIDQGLSLDEAVNAPRFHYQGFPPVVLSEAHSLDSDSLVDLWEREYRVIPFWSWGAAETILVKPSGQVQGSNDARRPAGAAQGEEAINQAPTSQS